MLKCFLHSIEDPYVRIKLKYLPSQVMFLIESLRNTDQPCWHGSVVVSTYEVTGSIPS